MEEGGRRREDALVGVALVAVAVVCLVFRYLPMVDLPQHHAMVSILRHHGDPAWDFAHRYTFDFVGRPYATVYWLAAALALVFPLRIAMGLVVALATVAPFLGLWALLRALERPRAPLLLALPLAFGSLWHWGFLNFLSGTGLFLGGLALAVHAARGAGRREPLLLGLLGPLLLLTHFHGLVMLLLVAPIFALAFGPDDRRRALLRGVAPLAPAAVLAATFVLLTWRQAEGAWAQMNPPIGERASRFVEFLAAGVLDPWPTVFVGGFFALAAVAMLVGVSDLSRRHRAALALALALQVTFYLALPLNTNTATFVSARHALLIALFVVPLIPDLRGRVALVVPAAFASLGLVVVVQHLAAFDREARELDAAIAPLPENQRLLPLIFAPRSPTTHPATFPYLHFGAYAQASHGGELSRTFATVWNVPIRYRADYARYPIRESLEWTPHLVSPEDLRHFDYVLVRGAPRWPATLRLGGLEVVARSGAFVLLRNPGALPAELPPR
ncbi:MAG: hypothetical protein IPJ34_32385 [Myxococcales bacterium]|nr:hypothetical protein [Myxococcales bacterium]